jgi:hypothetical protein
MRIIGGTRIGWGLGETAKQFIRPTRTVCDDILSFETPIVHAALGLQTPRH